MFDFDIKCTFTPEEIDAAISLVVVYKSRVNILQEVYEAVVKTGKTAIDEIHDILWQLVLCFDHNNNTFICSPDKLIDVRFLEQLMLKEFQYSHRQVYMEISNKLTNALLSFVSNSRGYEQVGRCI